MKREIRITPSILNADFSRLDEEIQRIAVASDLLHLDVMDNIFVPNFTFDFARSEQIIASSPIPVDAHLMVADVDSIAPAYAQAGCASVTIHVEATKNISATAKAIRSAGARCGLGIKPGTSVEDYADFIDSIDMFLIMTVEPGFGGQKFMYDMMEKVRKTRIIIGDRPIWLQVDGGVSLQTISAAAEAGADTFVAGSAVFNADDPAGMIESLRALAHSAAQ
jgi:ribulose-phosphate 3-epimerase